MFIFKSKSLCCRNTATDVQLTLLFTLLLAKNIFKHKQLILDASNEHSLRYIG